MPLMPNETRRVAALVNRLGVVKASAKLCLHHTTVLRLARGECVRPGTVALARLKLQTIATADGAEHQTSESETA